MAPIENKNSGLYIRHVATGLAVNLGIGSNKFYFTEFSDVIQTKYNETTTYGRMDPLVNYQGSTRKIQVGLQTNSGDYSKTWNEDAVHRVITRLQKMQYPVYEKVENALTIRSPPIVAVKMFNLIRDGDGKELLCAMDGFSFTPKAGANLSSSPYLKFGDKSLDTETSLKKAETPDGSMGFKHYNFKFSFTVLHRRPVGFVAANTINITDPDHKLGVYGGEGFRFLNGYKFGPREVFSSGSGGTQITAASLFNPADPTSPIQEAQIGNIFDDLSND